MQRLPTKPVKDLKPGQGNSKFMLAPGEQLIICPYDMSHQVTNLRIAVHLKKCRHNYENRMRNSGEAMQIVACKFNWAHHIPLPELFHHERICPDRFSVITHIMEFSNSHPAPLPAHLKKFSSVVYRSRGVTREDAESLPPTEEVCPEDDKSEASTVGWPSTVASSKDSKQTSMSLIPAWAKTIKKKEFVVPITRSLKSFPTGDSIVVKSTTEEGVCRILSFGDIDAAFKKRISSNESECSGNASSRGRISPTSSESTCSSVSTQVSRTQRERQERARALTNEEKNQDKKDYNWEYDPAVSSFNPTTRIENVLSLKYPTGLNKSERRSWRDHNVQKLRNCHGGTLLNVVPAPCPDPAANQDYLLKYTNDLLNGDMSDTDTSSSSVDLSESTWEDEDWITSEEASDTETVSDFGDTEADSDIANMDDFAEYFNKT